MLQINTLGGLGRDKLNFVRVRYMRTEAIWTSSFGSGTRSTYSIPMKAMTINTVDGTGNKTIRYTQSEEFITKRIPMGER